MTLSWAELWVLHFGIKIAQELALNKVVFESDSLVVVNMVSKGSTPVIHLKSLLEEISTLPRSADWQTKVLHVFRESNFCADFLAKCGMDGPPLFNLVNSVSPMLGLYISSNCRGSPRLVN